MNLVLAVLVVLVPQEKRLPEMKPLEWLEGTWAGENEYPGVGKLTERLDIKWALNGSFLVKEAEMRKGETVAWRDVTWFGWDFEKKGFFTATYGMEGSASRTSPIATAEKDAWAFEGRVVGPRGITEHRTTLRRTGPDSFTLTVERKADGKALDPLVLKYARAKVDRSSPKAVVAAYFAAVQKGDRAGADALLTKECIEREKSMKESFTRAFFDIGYKVKSYALRDVELKERVTIGVKAVLLTPEGKGENEGLQFQLVQKDGAWWIDSLD